MAKPSTVKKWLNPRDWWAHRQSQFRGPPWICAWCPAHQWKCTDQSRVHPNGCQWEWPSREERRRGSKKPREDGIQSTRGGDDLRERWLFHGIGREHAPFVRTDVVGKPTYRDSPMGKRKISLTKGILSFKNEKRSLVERWVARGIQSKVQ